MMRHSRLLTRGVTALAVAAATTLGVVAPSAALAADSAASSYLLAGSNQIARVLDANGSLVSPAAAVDGVGAGETLVAIAVRPQNNRLYGLSSTGTGAVRLYHIDMGSDAPIATPLSSAPVQFDDGSSLVAIGGTAFDIDFNPTVDRVRVISNTGLNFRMNPNNGALVDGNTSTAGTNPDGALNGGSTTANATSYTNSVVNTTVTTQYTIDSATDSLFIQNPPNAGTLVSGLKVTLNGAALDFSDAALDIPSSVAASASNAPATGMAYAVLTVNNDAGLYMLNLASGAATLVGGLGDLAVLDLALAPAVPVGMTMSGDAASLQRFRLDQPQEVVSVALTGVVAGETLVGFDGRPATGQLIGVGVNADANNATLYLIDPQTGVAAAIGTPGAIAYVDANGAAVDLPPAATGYGVDFNPTVDRVRVVTASGLNMRMNQLNGTAADGNTNVAGTQPDGNINGAATGVSATAYTNSYSGATITTQYALDAASNALFIQNPPNNGTETQVAMVMLNGAALDFSDANGFDIPTAVRAPSANAAVTRGEAYAALTVGGSTALYTLDLVTGNATQINTIGNGAAGSTGLVVWTPITPAAPFNVLLPVINK